MRIITQNFETVKVKDKGGMERHNYYKECLNEKVFIIYVYIIIYVFKLFLFLSYSQFKV